MKRVIHFSNARYFFFIFSSLLVLTGIVGYVANHGFNLGVDFKAGIAIQFQVAPAALAVQYTGPDSALLDVPAGEQALTAAGNIIITITSAANGNKTDYPFKYSDYPTLSGLADALAKVPGVSVERKGDLTLPPSALIPLPRPADMTGKAAYLNLNPATNHEYLASIADVREVLAPLGKYDLQAVGPAANQEFIGRMPADNTVANFQIAMETKVRQLLEAKYGVGQVILKETNFVGAQVAQSLGTQAIWLVFIAVALILVYMIFRFHPAIYGIAAVIGIMHDALVMLSFDAVFRVEIDAATIAAVLTILGYSINDTIVIFDRVRENKNLMRGQPLRTLLDTSVTQTLSRTFITSGATLLTVIALFVFTSGSIKNFSLNMIVGIVEGTYSTFISSFIVLEWTNASERRRKRREMDRFGIEGKETPEEALAVGAARPGASPRPLVAPVEEGVVVGDDEVSEGSKFGAEEAVEEGAEGSTAAEEPSEGQPEAGAVPAMGAVSGDGHAVPTPAPAGGGQAAASAQAGGQPAARPSNVIAFPGSSGSRKHKKHRRRHH